LTALTGHFAGEGLSERFDFNALKLPNDLPVSLPSRIIEQRPDVRAAEANVHSASALIGVAVANRLPQFNITGNVGKQAEAFENLFNPSPAFLFWTISGTVTKVLFDGFTLEQKQRAAEAGLDQALALYRSAVIVAFQNVADALQALEHDAETLGAALKAEQAADKYLRIVREQLRLGAVSSLQVLSAQQLYLQAQLSVVQAKANRYADTVALFQALGGGWWSRSDVDADTRGWRVIAVSVSDKDAAGERMPQ
jgi:NodT family efflux transporter outer membrane factor (OMF) lipoprotein